MPATEIISYMQITITITLSIDWPISVLQSQLDFAKCLPAKFTSVTLSFSSRRSIFTCSQCMKNAGEQILIHE